MGRSVLVLTAAALALPFAVLASALGDSSVVSAQTTEVPQRSAASEAEQYAAARRVAAIYRGIFDPSNPDNLIPGRSYRDMTAADFQSLPRETDPVILLPLLNYVKEYYDVVDSIKPTAMTREQFLHVLLREAARRNIILSDVENNTRFVPPEVTMQNVTVSRPLDVPAVQRSTATIPALDAVYRDVATTLLQNPRRVAVEMERDVATQIGFSNGGGAIHIEADAGAFILGYSAGANPLFFNGNQAGRPAGPLPLSLGFAVNVPELHEAYCAIVPAIMQTGRARGVDQNMAVSAGFLMAREDAANGFASNEIRLAFRGEPCPASPVPWDHQRMGRAITGIDMLPEQVGAAR